MRAARFVLRHGFDLLVMVVAVVVQIEIWGLDVPGPKAVVIPGALLATLPLLLRRRVPFAAPACVFGALAAMTFVEPGSTAGSPTLAAAVFLAFWSVGAHAPPREAIAGLALGFAAIVVVTERDPSVEYSETSAFFLVGACIWLAAVALQRRGRRTAQLEARTARLERERDERERAAVAAERRRIARDLHDVIAHSVGVMIVQAGAARMLLAEQAERAAGPLNAVEETGRQALAELRRLLGVLRAGGGAGGLTPQPGLAQVEALVAQAGEAGLPVELAVEGEPRSLPRGIELTAYRIVQESLTNVRKHAGAAAHARVVIRHGGEALEVSVTDDGHAEGASAPGGHGLIGMRERVALYGGELEAGPTAAGGFGVRALLPLEPTPRRGRRAPIEPAPIAELRPAPSARRLQERHWFDALVILVAVVSELELLVTPVPGPAPLLALGVLLWTLPLLLRDRFPFAAPVLCFAAQMLSIFAGDEVGGLLTGFAALLLAFWAIGAGNAPTQAIAGTAIGFATIAVATARDVRLDPGDGLNAAVVAAVVTLVAYAVRGRQRREAELEERADRLERERAAREGAIVSEERTRIARELHDLIAHCVSVMTVQAGAARLLLEEDPQRAVEPLLSVEETGRQALAEMRRLLAILRRETAERGLAPDPGLIDIRALLERYEGEGLPVRLAIEGESEPALPPGIDVAAYRVVQDALTNALEHAGPAHAWVTIRYRRRALELEIGHDGAASWNGEVTSGLARIRERVALYRGELSAGPRAEGGYAVNASFPLERP
ncbi:MAG: histidine kinase [Actinomycetota bacterium]|nr:histidine kinase [Actinomycetota bacterium]